eukprot:COSAG01_NODE_46262_length_401_cov_2.688742_1_plen_133_part_11
MYRECLGIPSQCFFMPKKCPKKTSLPMPVSTVRYDTVLVRARTRPPLFRSFTGWPPVPVPQRRRGAAARPRCIMTTVTYHGYDDATLLQNSSGARVVLTGHGGGRVLEYSLGGVNVIYLGTQHTGGQSQEGWK